MPDPSKEKQIAFLVAVRKLEKEHGVYLHTSEWLYLSDQAPEPRLGLQSAATTDEIEAKVQAAVEKQDKKLIEYAMAKDRVYLTPEDCEEAVNAGKDRLDMYRELLTWIAANAVEDAKLCCYVVTAGDPCKR